MNRPVKILDLGKDTKEFKINSWLKKIGDRVESDEILVELETDKATFELASDFDGFLAIINKEEGQTALVGEVIAEISEKDPKNLEIAKSNKEIVTYSKVKKVFISHSSKDENIVEEVIDLLEVIGLESNSIFCSSFNGYGISLGENFLERLKDELNNEVLVLFILSENFYKSPICLCEMGAAWIQTKQHIPIVIPPFDFNNIKGVIPLTQGLKINDNLAINLLKEKIESLFQIRGIQNLSSWERKRNKILNNIVNILQG